MGINPMNTTSANIWRPYHKLDNTSSTDLIWLMSHTTIDSILEH